MAGVAAVVLFGWILIILGVAGVASALALSLGGMALLAVRRSLRRQHV